MANVLPHVSDWVLNGHAADPGRGQVVTHFARLKADFGMLQELVLLIHQGRARARDRLYATPGAAILSGVRGAALFLLLLAARSPSLRVPRRRHDYEIWIIFSHRFRTRIGERLGSTEAAKRCHCDGESSPLSP